MKPAENQKADEPSMKARAAGKTVSFQEAFRFWVKLGLISFGGPTGQIAIMHSELVDKKQWISESRFLHALNYCMLLPGPEAQQLAIYIGWLLHRTLGGIVAGAFFVIPSILVLWTLSYVYAAFGNIPWIASIFYGLKAAVMAIVAATVVRIARKALKNEVMWGIAALAFLAIFFLKIPFPLIIAGAGMIGLIGGKLLPEKFIVIRGHNSPHNNADSVVLDDHSISPDHAKPTLARALKVILICGILWWTPVLLSGFLLGWDHTISREGIFFSKAAMVTFGGAYAVLPYVSQQAVEAFHWLRAEQMMDGLGLAETTPGPLIMVVQFVGFLGAWNQPGHLSPLVAATLGAVMTTWVTFVPCFLWIFLGAPYIESLRGNERISSTLSTITAAVVGVVLNLAVWFGIHALFPAGLGIDWFLLGLSIACYFAMDRFKLDVIATVGISALFGLLYKMLV